MARAVLRARFNDARVLLGADQNVSFDRVQILRRTFQAKLGTTTRRPSAWMTGADPVQYVSNPGGL